MSAEAEQTQAEGAAETQEEKSLLDQIIDDGRIGRDQGERDASKQQIATLIDEVMKGTVTVSKDIEAMISSRIADIDELLSRQLNGIMHAEEFQKLEGAWRGLQYFVNQSETSSMLKIQVMNVSKADLIKDFRKNPDFDQSAIFKKVYEEEFGTFGGAPYGALIGDYAFGRGPQDMELIEKIIKMDNSSVTDRLQGQIALEMKETEKGMKLLNKSCRKAEENGDLKSKCKQMVSFKN